MNFSVYYYIKILDLIFKLITIGMTGFEPATPCSQGRCATKLRYIPLLIIVMYGEKLFNAYF